MVWSKELVYKKKHSVVENQKQFDFKMKNKTKFQSRIMLNRYIYQLLLSFKLRLKVQF